MGFSMMEDMKINEIHLGFVGFGHMGQIIFRSLDQARLISHSKILFHRRDPSKSREDEKRYGITSTSIKNLIERSNVLLICVRPNQAEGVFQELAKAGLNSKKVISVMAGIKISSLQKFNPEMQVIRAMPNVASEIGQGMTLLSFGESASLDFRSSARILFSSLGTITELTETEMDIGSAIAGSGPAFVLELIEEIARIGEKEGIPYKKSLAMTAQTFLGAAAFVVKGASPEDLITQIATAGGMTMEGLKVLKASGIKQILETTIKTASARSKKFSEEF